MASKDEANPFTCNICLDDKVQKSPRVLHCLHSFCEACLNSWHTKRQSDGLDTKTQVECPVCRLKTTLPLGGLTALPHDFRVQEFAMYHNKKTNTPLCQACCNNGETSKAMVVCRTCNGRFCKTCGENHKKMPLFSQHEISVAICEVHGGALEFTCATCVSGICVECVYSRSHTDHEIHAAEDGLTKVKPKILDIKSELKNRVTACDIEVKEKLKLCLDKQCESEENISEGGELIKTTVDNIVKEAIEDHKNQHKEALKDVFDDKCKERAESLITDMENVFDLDVEETILELGKLSKLGKECIESAKAVHRSLPVPALISAKCCRLQGMEEVFEALQKCKLVCAMASALSKSNENSTPVLQRKIDCALGIEAPWNPNVTPEGDVIVCNYYGGAVYKIRMAGEIEILYNDKAVIATSVSDKLIYLLFKDGTNIVKLAPRQPPELIPLKLVDQEPRGITVEGSLAYILYKNGIMVHSLAEDESKWIVQDRNLHYFMLTSISGIKVLAFVDKETSQVFVCDDTGEEILNFGGRGDKGLFGLPDTIKRVANGNFLVSDWSNSKLVEYGPDGVFVRNLLSESDGLDHPTGFAVSHPHIWITECQKIDGKRKQSIKLFTYPP